jgi:pilus assembly protein CpaE
VLTKVLLTGRSPAAIHALETCFTGNKDFECRAKVLTNGHADPLHGLNWTPDIVVLRFDADHLAEIAAWSGQSDSRPQLVVVGPPGNMEAVRLAMRSGARDFLAEPLKRSELLATLQRIREDLSRRSAPERAGPLSVFVGAAGGVGTSFIATNVAHMLATAGGLSTALVDLDLNYAPLAHHLDLHPQRGLMEALEVVDSLDGHALAGYGGTHRSGLRLFSSAASHAVLSKDVPVERLSALLGLLRAHHSRVVVDTPHVLDSLNAMVFGMASSIHVVLQQSVLHVRNASRLARILREELAIPKDRVKFIVNRHTKDAIVELDDVRRALDSEAMSLVPSHYPSALQSIDAGTPLHEADRAASVVTRGLNQVYAELSGHKAEERGSFLKRALPSFMRN